MGWQREKHNNAKKTAKEKSNVVDELHMENPGIETNEMFIPENPNRNFDDLIVPKIVEQRIITALNKIRYHHILYGKWNLQKIDPQGRKVVINLFGSPGTGKTFCAEAIAQNLDKKIIKVNYAEIESKYPGQTAKNITAAFQKASETSSVLFFDEADSILGKRLTNISQSADHSINVSRSVMLLQLDGFNGIVIFASNLPENYDAAFVRRILAHIEFELPDEECRIRLWKYLLPLEVPRADDVTVEWLASNSEGLTGGDILNVVKLAASQSVARTGEEHKVLKSDILDAIAQVRSSKDKVGASAKSNKKVSTTEETIAPDELPPDIRASYDAVMNKENSEE